MKYIDAEKLIAKLTKMQFCLNAAYRHPQSDNIVRAISLEYDDIISIVNSLQQEQPSLPSDLDEAVDTFNREDAARMWDYEGKTEGEIVKAAFKAGAEWMAGQGVRAHCVESANLVSESSDARPHLITLLYEENKCTPYVRGGDNIDIIILKK